MHKKLNTKKRMISLVIPCFREEGNIEAIHQSCTNILDATDYDYELLFVDDGSPDNTNAAIRTLAEKHAHVRLIGFARNFGKETATTAGIHAAKGDAVIMIDADGQHPVELLPEFIRKWEAGAKVVIGVRKEYQSEGFVKRYGSRLFYGIFNKTSGTKLVPGSTDYRLIDRTVKQAFDQLTEHDRITRGLIDWLGFDRDYIEFTANDRMAGEAAYSQRKLVMLAFNSFTSLSFAPLYFFGYVGLIITILAILGGIFIAIEQFIFTDPLGLDVSPSAMLGMLILFLVGVILISQGLLAIYISKILKETQGRPLYIIDPSKSSDK